MKIFLGLLLGASGLAATILAADLPALKTADELWRHIQEMRQQGPSEQPMTSEERRAVAKKFIGELDATLGEFCKRFPSDARSWDARFMLFQCAHVLSDLQNRPYDLAADEKMLKEITTSMDAPAEKRAQASSFLIQIHISRAEQSTDAAAVDAINAEIGVFEKNYPRDPNKGHLQLLLVPLYQKTNPSKAESLLRSLANGNDPELAAEARRNLTTLDLRSKPLQLTFKAVDGSAVDLEKLRGKVVLLDFWATWCGPCVVSLPEVVTTYRRLHDKGFEIVGISLDQDKDKLVAFTRQRGMTWPQYFDGKVWQNAISTRFGVNAIPAMWLVNKKGFAHPVERDVLFAEVEKLLSE